MAAPWDFANTMIVRWVAGGVATLLVLDVAQINIPPRARGLSRLGDWSYALYLCHVPCILVVYQLWPSSFGVGAAWFAAVATALVMSAGLGVLDIHTYSYLKSAVDNAGEEHRRRLVNIYAGAFVIVSLIGAVVVSRSTIFIPALCRPALLC